MTATINASGGSCFVRVRPNISSDGMILCGRAMMCRSASRLCPGWAHRKVIGAAWAANLPPFASDKGLIRRAIEHCLRIGCDHRRFVESVSELPGPWISILIFGLTTDSSSSSTRKVSPPVTELKAVHLRLVLRLSAVEPPQTYFPVSTMMVNPIPVQDKLCRASIQAFIPITPVLGSSFAQLTSSRDHAVRAIRSRWRYLQHQLGLGTGLSVAITSSRHFGTTFAYRSSSLTAS